MIVRGDIKKYIGAVESEEIAARFYDKYALIIQGFEVSFLSKFLILQNQFGHLLKCQPKD